MVPVADAPSDAAIDRRMRRLMKPSPDGNYKIAEHVRALWENKATRDQAIRLFADCNYAPDRFQENRLL